MPRRIIFALALAAALAFAIAVPAAPRAHTALGFGLSALEDRQPRAESSEPEAFQAKPIDVTCTFTNPSYAGECVEKTTRTEKEKPTAACAPILECLNNERCVKTYCQATTLRQGWKLKKAE